MKLEPWPDEMLIKIKQGPLTMSMGRQTGKSSWYSTLREFMERPASRFVPYDLHHKLGLMIQDYMWWITNEREILNWMAESLPNGIDHHEGMTITFDTDQQRTMFLLRWS